MPNEIACKRAVPIVPVRNLESALERYESLGFRTRAWDGPQRYGFVSSGDAELHLTEAVGQDPVAVYLYVDDADAVHAAWTRAKPGGQLTTPRDTTWGLREFSYVDPDGTLHRVGSSK
jgi:predicted enzyme related to lactoylglutathione lyase